MNGFDDPAADIGTHIVIFPGGDRSRIGTADITGVEYERGEYACASVKTFTTANEAARYGRALAKKHSLSWDGPGIELDREDELDLGSIDE